MIQNLANDLQNIQQKHRAQSQQLEELYLQFYEINNKKEMLKNPFMPTKNQFEKVRPEVIAYVCSFLDFNAFLNFRLVDQQANKLIKQICPQKQEQLRQQAKMLEANLETITIEATQNLQVENLQTTAQFNQALEQLNQLQKAHIAEIKSLNNPPQLVVQVCYLLMILLDQYIYQKEDIWKQCQKLLNNESFLFMLQSLNINSITEKQLRKLAPLDQITIEQTRTCSYATVNLFSFLHAVVDIRRSKFYITKMKMEDVQKQIRNKNIQINHLQKIASN